VSSCLAFYYAGSKVVKGLRKIAWFLGWTEFATAFLVMASAVSLPNLFVGISSAMRGISELSFGDIAGNNLVALTIAVALAVFFSKGGIFARNQTIQMTSIFASISAIIPLIMILDGVLSQSDGIILIGLFIIYIFWLFSKKDRFIKVYQTESTVEPMTSFKNFFVGLGSVFVSLVIFIIAAQGIVLSARFFAEKFNAPLVLIGVIVVGLGSALPEIYFSIISARQKLSPLVLGNLMGSVIIPATLVLGIVALINPIEITDSISIAVARTFLLIAAVFFFIVIKTGKTITKKEGLALFFVYVIFLLVEIFIYYLWI